MFLLLVLPGHKEQFAESLQEMLTKTAIIFGSRWWDCLLVGVRFWAYDQGSIDGTLNTPNIVKARTGSRTTSII